MRMNVVHIGRGRVAVLSTLLAALGTACVLAAAGTPAVTRPATTQEDPTRTREVFTNLLQQGTNALAAGEYAAALDTFLDARDIFDKKMRGKISNVGSSEQIALLHGLALAYQLTGKPERASPLFEASSALDRACNSRGVSRQLLVTRTALDATQGYLAMRSVVSLTNYLKEHPDELDSEMLDLLFTVLQKADERVTNRALTLEPSIKLYNEFNGRLEVTRPGEKRWGVEWVSAAQFDSEMKKRTAAIKAYDAAADRADEAAAAVKDAERAYENSKKNGVYTKAGVQAAGNRLAAARNNLFEKQRLAQEARAAIPVVPALTKDDFKRLLTPHDVDVLVSKPGKTGTGAVASATTPASKAIPFSLGGTDASPTPPKPIHTGAVTPPVYVPPPAAPPSRRIFTRPSTGFAVGPDLLLTSAAAVKDSTRIAIEIPGAAPMEAKLERTGPEGLALLRVPGQHFAYVNLATGFNGGNVRCPAFPEVSIFGVTLEVIAGRALKPQADGWKVALNKHPRLPGAPLLDDTAALIGIEMGDRDDPRDRLPALPFETIKAFLAADLPARPSPAAGSGVIVQITASFEK